MIGLVRGGEEASIAGFQLTSLLNKHLEFPYNFGAGLYIYVFFLSAIFMGTIVLEGYAISF